MLSTSLGKSFYYQSLLWCSNINYSSTHFQSSATLVYEAFCKIHGTSALTDKCIVEDVRIVQGEVGTFCRRITCTDK